MKPFLTYIIQQIDSEWDIYFFFILEESVEHEFASQTNCLV